MKPKPAAPKSVLLSICPDCKHERGQYGECLGGPAMDRKEAAFEATVGALKRGIDFIQTINGDKDVAECMRAALALATQSQSPDARAKEKKG